ncbi:hypothetical protein PF005_g24397 [Phytophthora fragariae]|uniref:Uncharacterized protein n=1 Tax=Phytophthora fragariae TaxID=53985 RepID=A0A6A3W3V8_9STRA|nr:hypothetical protein PF003_g30391 [Phytophthora fragariae]KAE8924905.1 hypothetical protein PF009_g24873 [Phytophthora fragariae]KAE8991078.1 hypothetical protein PF011_g18091 [Phytophthora fragariae]KAE9092267.1 hypothetical protein PF007_g18576 [Phytophthora fragariae]KAE9097060.1 hypothetical protein PF006_g23660 [Phytophthora fragariae]
MEKARATRQGSTRAAVPGHSASTRSLGASGSRLRLSLLPKDAADRPSSPSPDTPGDDAVSATAQPSFDALELLGPSLSEVLTFVNPPQPRRLQEAQQDATSGGEPTAEDNQSHHGSSSSSLAAADASAKFDLRLSRSAVLGKLADPSVDNARKTQEYFAKLLSRIQCEATGLVLLHDATVVIFLETTAEQFLAILKQLQQQRIIEASSMKVLASCDDHGVRILQGLYFKKIVLNRSDAGEWTDDSAPQCVVETFLNLIKFTKKIGPMPPAEIRKCLTNLSNTDQTFLPSNDLVLWLLSRDELMALDEFLGFFDIPVAVELESERVWPVHPLIHY